MITSWGYIIMLLFINHTRQRFPYNRQVFPPWWLNERMNDFLFVFQFLFSNKPSVGGGAWWFFLSATDQMKWWDEMMGIKIESFSMKRLITQWTICTWHFPTSRRLCVFFFAFFFVLLLLLLSFMLKNKNQRFFIHLFLNVSWRPVTLFSRRRRPSPV